LPELVAETPEAYEALAIHLATQPGQLAELRRRLAGNRLTKSLFDAGKLARQMEAAYGQMFERYLALHA